jgi:transaldolase
MTSNNLFELIRLGQSPWYDNIDRRIIENGELQALFDLGITGVTSNPSIFEKAVKASDVYDPVIEDYAKRGASATDIYDNLTISDVQSAADMLSDKYRTSQGEDGYVSLEALPELAYDSQGTIHNATEIWKSVNRPNLLVKVPGTKPGFEAIRELTKEGINVNVTLIFSLDHYVGSARAYLDGLIERRNAGLEIDHIFSVASVFISRVDTMVDKQLADVGKKELQGKIAVANAKRIYQEFKKLFLDPPFEELRNSGGKVQKVLWGSTSTKNPAYTDVKYVEELIGKYTINTMPHKTLEAFVDHGRVESTLEKDLERELAYLEEIKRLKIDLNGICEGIQEKGVEDFANSFNGLIEAIEEKRSAKISS